ncbi:hypothetical protein A2707_03270 [Candidatus Saccharibacteria bacterium RIFCSPHIGHO2_01_FULL_45_15]|nr:MAG: hypothetical protein A2707_03270 [Candidatus Saccharibacteria bacterium RIFCSPHIGHO2_01_FULL_45_15]OGL27239.1 MAG: hypothetical protein A3C39_04460 [Candidatus Saccharibacteria bacterium RIFCSPHIGHO2_02_FULL_46_12]OGL32480.1 MAG: hypothetical protein A3E76_00300 [Candidatus Saccharibacteria bacterium RIFCSPHIGHO2_12_FULL_44_22]
MGFFSDLTSIINDTKAITNDFQSLKQEVVTSVTDTVAQTKSVATDITQQVSDTASAVKKPIEDITKNSQ